MAKTGGLSCQTVKSVGVQDRHVQDQRVCDCSPRLGELGPHGEAHQDDTRVDHILPRHDHRQRAPCGRQRAHLLLHPCGGRPAQAPAVPRPDPAAPPGPAPADVHQGPARGRRAAGRLHPRGRPGHDGLRGTHGARSGRAGSAADVCGDVSYPRQIPRRRHCQRQWPSGRERRAEPKMAQCAHGFGQSTERNRVQPPPSKPRPRRRWSGRAFVQIVTSSTRGSAGPHLPMVSDDLPPQFPAQGLASGRRPTTSSAPRSGCPLPSCSQCGDQACACRGGRPRCLARVARAQPHRRPQRRPAPDMAGPQAGPRLAPESTSSRAHSHARTHACMHAVAAVCGPSAASRLRTLPRAWWAVCDRGDFWRGVTALFVRTALSAASSPARCNLPRQLVAALATRSSCTWHLCMRACVLLRAVCSAALCGPAASCQGRLTDGAVLPESGLPFELEVQSRAANFQRQVVTFCPSFVCLRIPSCACVLPIQRNVSSA